MFTPGHLNRSQKSGGFFYLTIPTHRYTGLDWLKLPRLRLFFPKILWVFCGRSFFTCPRIHVPT